MQQTIFFGNGINRLSGDKFSWTNVLKTTLRENEQLLNWPVSYTHQFEDILLNDKLKISNENRRFHQAETSAKNGLQNYIGKVQLEENSLSVYQRLLALQADNYMTTNYDGYFENTLRNSRYSIKSEHISGHYLSVHRRYEYSDGKRTIMFWPIHGTHKQNDTVMFGFDQYCASISSLGHYFLRGSTREGGFDGVKNNSFKKWRKIQPSTSSNSYLTYRIKENPRVFNFTFWADLFFFSDVHIIGQGMDLSEIDLWWVLDKRARMKKLYPGKITNKIICYGYFERPVFELLKSYGVEMSNAKEGVSKDICWMPHYDEWIGQIHKYITQQKTNSNH